MSWETLRVAVVGLGYIAQHIHIPVWRKTLGAQLAAVCDTDTRLLAEVQARFAAPKAFESLNKMLEGEPVDLVDVCTPPQTHATLCASILRRGINCMVEKPLALTTVDADTILAAAQASGAKLHVVHNYSYLPVLLRAKALFAAGKIGEPLHVSINFAMPPEPAFLDARHWVHRLPGGALGEVAPHCAMHLLDFLAEIEDVTAVTYQGTKFPQLGTEAVKVLVRARNGLGSFTVAFSAPTRKLTMDILGSKLWVSADCDSQVLVTYPAMRPGRPIFTRGVRAASDIFQRAQGMVAATVKVATRQWEPQIEGHKYLFRQSVRALHGRGVYPVSPEKARDVVRIVEYAFKGAAMRPGAAFRDAEATHA